MGNFKIITFDELIKRLEQYSYSQLHIHHTWKPDHFDFNGENHIRLQEGMYNYHVNTLGWKDIGQHITVMPDGLIVTGRDFGETPASISGWNKGAFSVEMLGNFDVGHDSFDGMQKETVLKITKYFIDRFGEEVVKFHNEGPKVAKTCPGTSINKEEFLKEVNDLGMIFTDVEDDRWSSPYIKAAKNLGLIKGLGDGTFNPEGALTREEAAVLIIRLYEKVTGEKIVK